MQNKPYKVPLHIRFNRVIMRPIFQALYGLMGRIRIQGRANIPLGTPYIAAINHVSIFDPPFMLSFWPEFLEIIGAAEVFKKSGQGIILSLYGTILVYHGEYDRALLEKTVAVLKTGRPLAIFPEGGRSHVTAMQRAMPGIGFILEKTQVPVVPVGIAGTTGDFWQRAKRGEKPLIEMNIGRPIHFETSAFSSGALRKTARQSVADTIMQHIAGLLPEEYHGAYAGKAISRGG